MQDKIITVGDIAIGGTNPFALITGPCQLENRDHAFMMAEKIAEACAKSGTQFIFKASYDKANRSSINTQRGLGIEEGLRILSDIRAAFGCPILTDVHEAAQCQTAGTVVDILQIPAFLCRQTDLLLAAGKTGRAINVKKGQFLAPWDMPRLAITPWSAIFVVCRLWPILVIRLCLTPRIRFNNRAGKVIHQGVNANSHRFWPEPPARLASLRCLSKPIKTRTPRQAMAQI